MSKSSHVVMLIILAVGMTAFAYKKDPEYLKARRNGGELRMILSVTDDAGNAVSNASVKVLMGMNFREKAYYITGRTDGNGQFAVEGKTTGNEIEIEVTNDGYYNSMQKMCFVKMGNEYDVKDGRWQPWGMLLPMTLRKIRAPVQLIVHRDLYPIPCTNKVFGFDMALKDWVLPYGKGKVADFEVFLTWDGKPLYYTKRTQLDIRFSEKYAGYYPFDNIKGSSFGGPYFAETNHAFRTGFSCTSSYENGNPCYQGLEQGKSLIVRSRCKADNEGHLISANYATIKNLTVEAGWAGEVMMMIRYYFNPTPNDTNLEPKWAR